MDLATSLPTFKLNKLKDGINKMISENPYTRDFKEKVIRALTGQYTEEDILRVEREQRELLEQIEREMEIKHSVEATESIVFLGTAKEICDKYIDDNQIQSSET